MVNNVKMAMNMGYLDAPPGTLISVNEARQLPNERVVIVATGSQGEPTSALVRMANGEHQDIEIEPGDTVVISASPIPGNERVVASTIDNLLRQGANVLYSRVANVHVHGHASKEELKMMLSLVRPKFFVPVHGEYRHLMAHAAIAESMGIAHENIFLLEDGDVLELTSEAGEVVDSVPAASIYVDGRRTWEADSSVFAQRRRLARDGIVSLAITINKQTGDSLRPASFGFVDLDDFPGLFAEVSNVALTALDRERAGVLELGQAKAKISASVSDFLYEETGKRPTVLVIVEEV